MVAHGVPAVKHDHFWMVLGLRMVWGGIVVHAMTALLNPYFRLQLRYLGPEDASKLGRRFLAEKGQLDTVQYRVPPFA